METVILQFQTPHDFADFRKKVYESIIEVNIKNLTMVCNCEMIDIAQAMNYFGAKVIEEK